MLSVRYCCQTRCECDNKRLDLLFKVRSYDNPLSHSLRMSCGQSDLVQVNMRNFATRFFCKIVKSDFIITGRMHLRDIAVRVARKCLSFGVARL